MVIDEEFSVDEMLVESTKTMLIDNVGTSIVNIPINTTNGYEMTLHDEMYVYLLIFA